MTLFSGIVGNGFDSDPDDVKSLRRSLGQLGYKDENPNFELIDYRLDRNIRDFQKNNDLKVDGTVTPNGETSKEINKQEEISRRIAEKEKELKEVKQIRSIAEKVERTAATVAGRQVGAVVGATIGVRVRNPKRGARIGGAIGAGVGNIGSKVKDAMTTSDLEKKEQEIERQLEILEGK